jgi:hypothetical protein
VTEPDDDDVNCTRAELASEIERLVAAGDGHLAESLMGDNIPLICAALRMHDRLVELLSA